jgi:hypothetical protein
MERWTIKDLNNISDLGFAIRILNERKRGLNPYSPLGSKITQAVLSLEELRAEEMRRDTQNASENVMRDNMLAGGYVLVSTYATLSDEEAKALRDDDETPTAVIAIKKDFLEEWIKPEYASLEDFFGDYTYDTIEGLMGEAILHGAFAFEYRDGLDDPFIFGYGLDENAMLAYTDFLSGKLQENGLEEASKYLDCLLSI